MNTTTTCARCEGERVQGHVCPDCGEVQPGAPAAVHKAAFLAPLRREVQQMLESTLEGLDSKARRAQVRGWVLDFGVPPQHLRDALDGKASVEVLARVANHFGLAPELKMRGLW